MALPNPGKLVAFVANPHTARRILHLASPRFDVTVEYAAAAALNATISAGPGTVLVVEQPADDGQTIRPAGPGSVALLEATRLRCPGVHRVMLAPADQMATLIPILHRGMANAIVALPINPVEFLTAILSKPALAPTETPVGAEAAPAPLPGDFAWNASMPN